MQGVSASRSTGKERDSETGLDYFGARFYGSNMGRFLTPDWSAAPMPVPYADLNDPQSLNLYGYVRNNPINRTDPNGHWCIFGRIGPRALRRLLHHRHRRNLLRLSRRERRSLTWQMRRDAPEKIRLFNQPGLRVHQPEQLTAIRQPAKS